MQFRRARNFTTLLLAASFAIGMSTVARADVLDGVLEVRSAYVTVEQGVFQLFARVAYPVNDDIRAALKDGLMLNFDLDVVVTRERRFWVDETVAEYTLRRELLYHAVSDRYVARDVDARNNDQHSFSTLEEALEALGTVDSWPFLLAPQLSPNRQYRVSLRAGVRRGRLSDTMRVVLFWTDGWHRESEWFSWSLQR
jgi:hypothetical protein